MFGKKDSVDKGLPFGLTRFLSWISLILILASSVTLAFFIGNSARNTLLLRQQQYAMLMASNLNQQIYRRFTLPTFLTFGRIALRQSMQYELIRLKEELGITFVYVTHDQEEALTMSDTIVVMNQGYIQQIGTPENIYNEPENAFVADFIGHSNIIDGIMIKDELVEILGARWACVDKGFGNNKPVDVVIRPEDVELVDPSEGTLQGEVTSLIFKGVHYELDVMAGGYEWLVHTTRFVPVGTKVGIKVIPFNIQIMHKPESSDEKAVEIDA